MNKKLILIVSLLCLTTFGSVFAQVETLRPTDFTDSARSKATATMFESDSDYVDVDDIFLIDRAFFSAGYQPALVLGNYNSMGNMSAFWAMPINDNMTIGIAGEYKMEATRRDDSIFPGDRILGSIDTTQILTENSAFNIRPVFKFGAFAFSYRIFREGSYRSADEATTIIPSGTQVLTNREVTSGTRWEHEIGLAYKTDLFKIYVPIGTIIQMGIENRTADHDAEGEPGRIIDSMDTGFDNTKAYLYINPEIEFPVEIGPITELKAGLRFNTAIYNPAGARENITTYSGDDITGTEIKENKEVVSVADQSDISFGAFFETTMEWDTWEDKIGFIFQPQIGVDYQHFNGGTKTTTTTITPVEGDSEETVVEPTTSEYENRFTPYLGANVGAVIQPVDWFEFRAGLRYQFNWDNRTSTVSYKIQEGGKINDHNYTFSSEFEVYSGFGFIFGEDFFIDIYIAAGNFIDTDDNFINADGTAYETSFDLFDIRNYGVQLSYRF